MITDTEIKSKGIAILSKYMGNVEAERFVALIQRDRFDYTQWRQDGLDDNLSIEDISREAMELHRKEMA